MSIINNSLRIGSFPSVLREAVITPLIKKPTLNPDLFKNYRPVSNLTTLGKIIEYPTVSRFKQHFQINGLGETFQSLYKSHHSTETALLKVKNDMSSELDKGKVIMLVLLDLSSAFDTIDHDILVEPKNGLRVILRTVIVEFAFLVNILKNFRSSMVLPRARLQVHLVLLRMPNLLLPSSTVFRLRIISTLTILSFTLVSISKSSGDIASAKLRLTNCITEIRSWMLANKLKLNDSKTELFLIASPRHAEIVSHLDVDLKIGGSVITPSS